MSLKSCQYVWNNPVCSPLYKLNFQAHEEIVLGTKLPKMPYPSKEKRYHLDKNLSLSGLHKKYDFTVMHNTSHSPEWLFSSRLIKMKSKPTLVVSSGWRNQDLAAPPSHFYCSGKAQSICCSYFNTSREKTFCALGSSKQKIPVRNPVRMTPLTGYGWVQRM